MLKKPLFLETFLLVVLVKVLDYIAQTRNLYWSVYEFDSVVHFFGGAAIAMLFLWLYFFSGFFNPTERSLGKFLAVAFLGAMTIAVLWEAYELLLGEAVLQKNEYFYDTTLDFIMDMLGLIAASFYAYLREQKSASQKESIQNHEQTHT